MAASSVFYGSGAARDGSVYTTIGRPIKGATLYTARFRQLIERPDHEKHQQAPEKSW
jgi:hypothetical protein